MLLSTAELISSDLTRYRNQPPQDIRASDTHEDPEFPADDHNCIFIAFKPFLCQKRWASAAQITEKRTAFVFWQMAAILCTLAQLLDVIADHGSLAIH